MSPDSETVELSLLCDILALYANANTRLNPNTSRRIFSVLLVHRWRLALLTTLPMMHRGMY